MQYSSESVTYESISLRVARVSTTQQPVQTAAEDNVNMEENPSYHTVDSSSPQGKPLNNRI